MAIHIQLRRDTELNWFNVNPILAQGELGIELETARIKIGDGVTFWRELEYSIGFSGISGYSGVSGYSGEEGVRGYSGDIGESGHSGESGYSGYSGYSGSGDSKTNKSFLEVMG